MVCVGRGLSGLEYSGSLFPLPLTTRLALGCLFSPEDKLPEDRGPVFLAVGVVLSLSKQEKYSSHFMTYISEG